MLSVKQGSISIIFWVFGMNRPGIEPKFPKPLANTLNINRQYANIYFKLESISSVMTQCRLEDLPRIMADRDGWDKDR